MNEQIDGVSALTLVLIASVGMDQVVTLTLGLVSRLDRWASKKLEKWREHLPDPALLTGIRQQKALKAQNVGYKVIAFVGGVSLAGFGQLQMLEALWPEYGGMLEGIQGIEGSSNLVDSLITGLVFMVGAEKAGAILKVVGVDVDAEKPVEISGTLLLDADAQATVEAEAPAKD